MMRSQRRPRCGPWGSDVAYELTVILRFEHPEDIPSREDLESEFDCDVQLYTEEEV